MNVNRSLKTNSATILFKEIERIFLARGIIKEGRMKLCIAEKPSVAKELSRILGANSRKDGYYEGNGYQVSWTFGHLCTLKTPDDYTTNWKWWKLSELPMIPDRFGIKLIKNDGIEKQFNTIQKLVDNCEEVINCGDAGIEGELIQRWVLLKAKCKKPLKRLWISSLTEEAIKEGFQDLKEGSQYDKLYAAGNARAIGDWLLGMNATRLYTLKYSNGKSVLSIGRVQTPTLALIVNRYEEIQNFVPQKYWELKTTYREVQFSSTKGKFKTKEEASEILGVIGQEEFEIISSQKKKGKEQPPKLFDLTSLQVECNSKFDFSADDTLKYIQSLYESKLVTYPRVDTTFLPNDMYPKVGKILQGLKPYANLTAKIQEGKIRKNKKVFDDKKITDHHAIIPTGIEPRNLSLEQKKVYDTIARRFISVFYPDCIISNTTVLGKAGEYEFKATGKLILEPGWRELYPQKNNTTGGKTGEQIMPEFSKGETGPHTPDLQEKETSPPKLFTEATLLRAMETAGKNIEDEELRDAMKENGIGRPSTRANIIETLFKRRYIVRSRKNLVPTETGVELINTISNQLLKSVELTGMWEKKLRLIESGNYEPQTFLDEMKQMVSELILEVKRDKQKTITIQEETKPEPPKKASPKAKNTDELLCPKCKKGKLLKGKSAYGCSMFKEGCNFRIAFENNGKKLTAKQLSDLIQKGKTNLIKGFLVDGEKQNGKLVLTDSFAIKLDLLAETGQVKKPQGFVCPKCNKGTLLKGKTAYGCSLYKEGCKFILSFEHLNREYKTQLLNQKILSREKERLNGAD